MEIGDYNFKTGEKLFQLPIALIYLQIGNRRVSTLDIDHFVDFI